MCDYCDCRAQPQIAALSAEHERMLSVTAAIRRSVAAGRAVSAEVDELGGLLSPHAEREEIGLFAVLRDAGVDASYVGRFEDEHRRIETLLSSARDDVPAAVMLVDLLEDHILHEETDMFPASRQLLDAEMWAAVDDAVSRAARPAVTG